MKVKVSLLGRILNKVLFFSCICLFCPDCLSQFSWAASGAVRERPTPISVQGVISFLLREDPPPETLLLKHHRHWGCCSPLAFLFLCCSLWLLLVTPLFCLCLLAQCFLWIPIFSLGSLPFSPPKKNTACMLFSTQYNYNRSCTISYYSSFSLYARCHILQPLSFPRRIAVSYCIPLATVSPILSSPYFYVPRSFTLCTCGTMNTGH